MELLAIVIAIFLFYENDDSPSISSSLRKILAKKVKE
jgi:hypothetical protein